MFRGEMMTTDGIVLEKQELEAPPEPREFTYQNSAGRLIEIRAIDELLQLIVEETDHCRKMREAQVWAENQIQEAEYWAKRHRLDVLASESRLIALGRILTEFGLDKLTMSREGA